MPFLLEVLWEEVKSSIMKKIPVSCKGEPGCL
jgi:hypothetical protein